MQSFTPGIEQPHVSVQGRVQQPFQKNLDAKLTVSQPNVFLTNKVNCILGSSRGSVTSRPREVLCFLGIDEATAVPVFETLSTAKMLRNWRVQWRATERSTWDHKKWGEIRGLKLFSLAKKRRAKGDLISAYNYMRGSYKDGGARIFLVLADYLKKVREPQTAA